MLKEPDVIICNEELYSFCEVIDDYEKIEFDINRPEQERFTIVVFLKD